MSVDQAEHPYRPGTRSFCEAYSVLANALLTMRLDQEDDFTWFNTTDAIQKSMLVFIAPEDDEVIWGSGFPTGSICPGKSGRLVGMAGSYYMVKLKSGEPDIPFGKKVYLATDVSGNFLGATVTPPTYGCGIGRAVIDIETVVEGEDDAIIVAPAGTRNVRVYMPYNYVPQVFPAL